MNRDAKRATGQGVPSERHAIGITSMCLRSGGVQLPFALSGSLPEGELLVHDVDADEPIVLWSEPPRRLSGLAPLFERHEVQVNDQLVLELRGDDVRIAVAKRPRRSRPKVTPSTWTSHYEQPQRTESKRTESQLTESHRDAATNHDRDEDATRAAAADRAIDREGAEPRVRARPGTDTNARADDEERAGATPDRAVDRYRADRADDAADEYEDEYEDGFGDERTGFEPYAPRDLRRTGPAQVRPPDDATTSPSGRAPMGRPIDGVLQDDDDAPRAPRVTVRPASDARPSSGDGDRSTAGGAGARASDRGGAQRSGGGPFGGLLRAARGWFGGRDRPRDGDDDPSETAPDLDLEAEDWIDAWDADAGETDADPDAFDTAHAMGESVTPASTHTRAPARAPTEVPGRAAGQTAEDAPVGAPRRHTHVGRHPTPEETTHAVEHAEAVDVPDDATDEATDLGTARDDPSAATDPENHDERPEKRADARPERGARVPSWLASGTPLFPDAKDPSTDASTDLGQQAEHDEPENVADGDEAQAESADAAADRPAADRPAADRPAAGSVESPRERGATLPSGVPIRAERFLGGDLRTRLLRFLASPEMPLIAKAELIAKRFDLEPATAQEMLADIADDPPDGLRLTAVREGAWRIERRSV